MNKLVYVDTYQIHPLLRVGRAKTWRWRVINAGNHQPMGHSGKTYFNRGDCEEAARQLFGSNTTVFLRRAEQPDELLRRGSFAG